MANLGTGAFGTRADCLHHLSGMGLWWLWQGANGAEVLNYCASLFLYIHMFNSVTSVHTFGIEAVLPIGLSLAALTFPVDVLIASGVFLGLEECKLVVLGMLKLVVVL